MAVPSIRGETAEQSMAGRVGPTICRALRLGRLGQRQPKHSSDQLSVRPHRSGMNQNISVPRSEREIEGCYPLCAESRVFLSPRGEDSAVLMLCVRSASVCWERLFSRPACALSSTSAIEPLMLQLTGQLNAIGYLWTVNAGGASLARYTSKREILSGERARVQDPLRPRVDVTNPAFDNLASVRRTNVGSAFTLCARKPDVSSSPSLYAMTARMCAATENWTLV